MKVNTGFKKNISTFHSILDIVSITFANINGNYFTELTLFDLLKAFDIDTDPLDILLARLEHHGIRGPTQSLMQSFLNRQQFVCIYVTNSTIKVIPYGVAQGSTFGPLQFLEFINDLPNAITGTPRLFTYDTCLISDNANPIILQKKRHWTLLQSTTGALPIN